MPKKVDFFLLRGCVVGSLLALYCNSQRVAGAVVTVVVVVAAAAAAVVVVVVAVALLL